MLVKMDCTGKIKSLYMCDRCKAELKARVNERYRIVVQQMPEEKRVKRWDFCR